MLHHHKHCSDSCDSSQCKCARTYTVKNISSLLDHVDYEMWKISLINVNELKYGYKKQSGLEELVSELSLFKFILSNKLDSLIYNYKFCVCNCRLQKIIERFSKLLSKKSRIDKSIETDKSNLDGWILKNKTCTSKEKWEECACNYITYLGLDITVVEHIDKLLFDIEVTPKFKDILLDISASRKNKDLFFDKTVEKKAKLEYDIIVKETNAALTFDQYYSLRNSGITFDTIRTSYNNDISFQPSVDSNSIHICTKNCNYLIP